MICNIKLWFFVLFLTKEITSIRASYSASDKSDITKYLNSTIHKIFRSAKGVAVNFLLKKITNLQPKTYEYNLTRKVQGYRDQIIFRNVTFPSLSFGRWPRSNNRKYIEYDFLNNKIQIGLVYVRIKFNCDIYSDKDTFYSSFQTDATFGHPSPWSCIINVTKLPKTNLENIFQIDMPLPKSAGFGYNFNYQQYEAVTRNNDLMEEIKSRIPSMLIENMNHNEKLMRALNKSYGFRPKKHLLAKRKNFFHNEYQYHYRIPSAKYFCFKLINICISGLSNFQSLKHHYSPDEKPIYTLWIKDIRGNATLDYGSESESPLELNFHADYLSISRDRFAESRYGGGLRVDAHWCTVKTVPGNIPLTGVQSEGVMRSIESAIAFSLTPQSKVRNVHEMEAALRQKCSEISSSLSWEDVKKSYRKWIPFGSDDEF